MRSVPRIGILIIRDVPREGILTNYFLPGVGNLNFFLKKMSKYPPSGLTLIGA